MLFYNAVEKAVRTIQSLMRQQGADVDVRVLDNASAQDALGRLRATLPQADIESLPVNLGYTGGNNAALQRGLQAGYDYVLLCNQDIELDPTAVAHLLETAAAYPDAALIGGTEVCFRTGSRRAAGGAGFSFWSGRFRWHRDERPPQAAGRIVDFVQGALVLVSTRAVAAGLRFDEALFLYYDEVDLGLQARQLGFSVVLDERVDVRHDNAEAFLNPVAAYYHQRNRVYIVRKYGSGTALTLHALYAGCLELPVKSLVRALQGHRSFVAASWAGYVDGLRNRMGEGRGASWRPSAAN